MAFKYPIFVLFYFFYLPYVFAQTDSTDKKIIGRLKGFVQKFKQDAENFENNKQKNKLLCANLATASTTGFFPSDLIESKIRIKSNSYVYRFYVDIKFKRPFMLYIELERGRHFEINKRGINKLEETKEVFFQKIISLLEKADVGQDIQKDLEVMLLNMLKDCEKHKDCEHCWLITQCE